MDARMRSGEKLEEHIIEGLDASTKEGYAKLVSMFDGIDGPVYVADPDTHEILYVNNAVRKMFGDVSGKKCYTVFQKSESPCSFCTNTYIFNENVGKSHVWDFQNQRNKRWYHCIDKAIHWPDGRLVRFEMAIDITRRKEAEDELAKLNKELIKSNKQLKELALRDTHTGLYNHRYLNDVIEAEFQRARRYVHALSVIMLDIDYFKSINDVYGHTFGDTVLKQFATQLKKMVGVYDIVVRYGGEEFVIVLPSAPRCKAILLTQRFLDALTLCNFGTRIHSVKLKVSAAVASYPEDRIFRGIELVELSDRLLDKAKEDGGNRVYSSGDLVVAEKDGTANGDDSAHGEVKFLKEKIDTLTRRGNQVIVEAILAFAKTIELKDHYTGEHTEQTVRYATEIAKGLKLPKEEVECVREAAALHDLGKIGVSEKILQKKGKLTAREFESIKKHPQIGVDIIRPIHFMRDLIPFVLYHHERWDGKGYPMGLKGAEIPVGARVVSVADVYQALTSDRPYRKAFSRREALHIMKDGSGSQFDPTVVDTFITILRRER